MNPIWTDDIENQQCPPEPVNLSGSSTSGNQINLSWTDNSTNETGFKIERNGSLITTTAADTNNYSNSSLQCGTTYNYSVTATNVNGNSTAATASATTVSCPITVYHKLTIEKIGNGTISDTSYGIDCGTKCEYNYADQSKLSLTVTPDNGWIFTGWNGDCDSNGEVRINSDKNCIAMFISPSIEISATTLNVTEGISNNSYSLWLNFQPTAPVTITLNGSNELIFEPALLTFDSNNWDVPQTVQITDINDDLVEGSHEHIISHTVTSNDSYFNNLLIEDVIVQVIDDDNVGIHLSTYDMTINEGYIDNSYNIILTTQPTNDINITLITSANTNINPTTLVFTTDNWNIPQDITIFVNDDNLAEGEHQHEPIHHKVTSEDLNYHALPLNDVTVHIIDNDTSGILLSDYELNINEGDFGSITIALNSTPIQSVTINLIPEDDISVSPATLSFDSNNWNIPQTIFITTIDDELVTNEIHTVRINTTSNDGNYNNLQIENLTVNVVDDEKPSVQVSTDQVTVFEEGIGGNYTLVLTVEPASPVTVSLTASEHSQVIPKTIIFTPSNWNIGQTVTVTAVDDDLVEEDAHINTIIHKVTSSDANYNNLLVTDVTVNIVDTVSRLDLGPIILICQDCSIKNASLVDIISLPESTESYTFPESLVTFELEASETVHLDIYYKFVNVLNDFVYRKYGPTTPDANNTAAWYNFTNATFELVNIDGFVGIVKVGLTLTNGELGDDTGVDEIIIDDGGIAVQIAVQDVNTTTEPPELDYDYGLPISCNADGSNVNGICDVGQQIFPETINISDNASISNAIFEADVENNGIIGNSTIEAGVTLTGGYLTGTITNEGTIENVTFVGAELTGGTLSGKITNNSQVGGVIKDVELAAGTVVKGGKIAGTITGNPIDKPVITGAEIMPGTILSNKPNSNNIRKCSIR